MLFRFTLPLVTSPISGWSRVGEAAALAHPSGDSSGGPYRLVASAAIVSLAATAIGWGVRPASTAAGAVLHVLAASLAYLGGPVVALSLAHHLLPRQARTPRAEWFAAGSLVPLALAGAGNLAPYPVLSFALALAGAALSVRTAWVGANALLALEGQARFRAAAAPAGVAVGVALLATSVRMVLPS